MCVPQSREGMRVDSERYRCGNQEWAYVQALACTGSVCDSCLPQVVLVCDKTRVPKQVVGVVQQTTPPKKLLSSCA